MAIRHDDIYRFRRAVSSGLDITFKLLTESPNESADELLAVALDSPLDELRSAALTAVLGRHTPRCHRKLINDWHQLPAEWRTQLAQRQEMLAQAVRDAVLDPDPQTCANGCEALLSFRNYDLLSLLISIAENEEKPNHGLLSQTLLKLIEAFYEELAGPRDYSNRRDPQRMREFILGQFESSLARFARHQSPEILEAFLLLAPRDNAVLKQILNDPRHIAYLPVSELLTNSPRGGIMRLMLSFLDDSSAPSAAMTLLAHRSDQRFIEYVLKKIGFEPAVQVALNLKRIESIPWLQENLSALGKFDEASQHAVAMLAVRSGIPRRLAFRVIEWLLLHGKPGGRRQAALLLAEFQGAEANALLLQALGDRDPQVVANLIAQIRPRGIPGAMGRLMEYLLNPNTIIQQAARESLAEFTFKRYLSVYDMLEPEVRASTGELVLKVDTNALNELLNEFQAPARSRKLRAIAMTQLLGVVYAMEEALIELLTNEDHIVRAEAAKALAQCDTQSARQALQDSLADRSVIVQEAARNGLTELAQLPAPKVPELPWEAGAAI